MKKIFGVMCLFVFMSAGLTPAISAQFEDEEVLPEIKYITFSQDARGLCLP